MDLCSMLTITILGTTIPFARIPHGDCSSKEFCCRLNETEDIRYYLYNNANYSKNPLQIPFSDNKTMNDIINKGNINKTLLTIIYVHGFVDHYDSWPGQNIRKAYLQRGGYNIILVDWSSLDSIPWYLTAVRNTILTGRYLAIFIKKLTEIGFPIENLHLIGFSLGAQVIGFAGKELRYPDGSPMLKRITGLDPAFPLYYFTNKRQRLDKTDAEYVDVIHTDGGLNGFPFSLGHVDFYPNGGHKLQPGCSLLQVLEERNPNIYDITACNHNRAWHYYSVSVIKSNAFPGVRCERYFGVLQCNKSIINYMGFASDPSKPGNYYVKTKAVKAIWPNEQEAFKH